MLDESSSPAPLKLIYIVCVRRNRVKIHSIHPRPQLIRFNAELCLMMRQKYALSGAGPGRSQSLRSDCGRRWQVGQMWVPRPATRVFSMAAPQRGQGWPSRRKTLANLSRYEPGVPSAWM